MALLSDVPKVIRSYGFFGFIKRVWEEIEEDQLLAWAAALAYSWLFAVFPFLIFLMTLLPYLPAELKGTAYKEIQGLVFQFFPDQAAQVVWGNIDQAVQNLLNNREGKLAPRLIGLGLALWAASSGMSMTMASLDMCYEVHKGRPFYIQRPLAVGVTIIFSAMVLLVVCLLPIGSLVRHWLAEKYPEMRGWLIVFELIRWPAAILLLIAALSVLYQKGPAIKRRWTWITPGGVFCVAVWIGLGLLFNLYLKKFGQYNETYGTVGGVVVLLLFFYIDAVVLLVGAEINSEIDFKILGVDRGSRDYTTAEAAVRPLKRKGARAKPSRAQGLSDNPSIVPTPAASDDVLAVQDPDNPEGHSKLEKRQ
jgi:membrane protein